MKKCGSVLKKVPLVKELWTKLGDTIKEEDPVFSEITQTLKGILNKTEVVEKGVADSFDDPVAVK